MEISEYDLHVKIVEEAKAQVEMTVAFWRSRYGALEQKLKDERSQTIDRHAKRSAECSELVSQIRAQGESINEMAATINAQKRQISRLRREIMKKSNPSPRWYIPEHTRRAIV